VLVSDRGGKQQLVVANPAGDRQRVVTGEATGIAAPAWGPFAR
jgi:Tol biopolymer transport system component